MPRWLSRHLDKVLWPIVVTVVGAVFTALLLSWFQDHSADIVVRQFLSTVEIGKSVPQKIGELVLDYQPDIVSGS